MRPVGSGRRQSARWYLCQAPKQAGTSTAGHSKAAGFHAKQAGGCWPPPDYIERGFRAEDGSIGVGARQRGQGDHLSPSNVSLNCLRHPLGRVRFGTGVSRYNPRFAAQARCACHGGRIASGSDGTVSLAPAPLPSSGGPAASLPVPRKPHPRGRTPA